MRRAETVMALALVVVAGILLREALRLPVAWTGIGPGAGFLPFWLTVGMAICAVVIFFQSVRGGIAGRGNGSFIATYAWKPLLVVFLPMVTVVALMDYLGIYFGGGVYLAGYMRLVGRHRWLAIALVSILVPLVLFFIFEKWFLLPLPKGVILEYLLYER